MNNSRVAVYTGSFDPITLGHINVIERASRLVDKLIVGIGINIEKQSLFTSDERLELVKRATRQLPNVEVRQFSGLAVHFVRECGSRVMLRGVRSLTDIETEFTMTLANRKLDPTVETVFLMADEQFYACFQFAAETNHAAGDRRGVGPVRAEGYHSRFAPSLPAAEIVPLAADVLESTART